MSCFPRLLSCLYLALALLAAGTWNLHLLEAGHPSEEHCHVCAAVASPQLNADCGSELLSAPENFALLLPGAPVSVKAGRVQPVFLGRAPPL